MRKRLLRLAARARRRWRGLDDDARAFAFGYAVLLPAFLTPLFATPILPSLDAPFHLAIADMLAKSGDASPYADFYSARMWPPSPAFFWVALAVLGQIVSPVNALRILVCAYVATFPLALAAFTRRIGGSAAPALLAFPLAYNLALHFGFLGYALSLPIVLVTLTRAATLFEAKTNVLRETAFLSAWAAFLYGVHLETWALGVVTIVAMSVAARAPLRQRALALVALVPSIGLFALWNASTPWLLRPPQKISEAIPALVAARQAEVAGRSWIADIGSRFEGLPMHLLRGFRDGSDRIAGLAILVLVAVHALAMIGPSLRHPLARARPCLFVIALTGYLFLPHHFDSHEAMSVAPRLAPLVVVAAIAALPVRAEPSMRVLQWLRRAVFAVGIAYGAVLVREYRAFGVEITDFRNVMDRVPPGGRAVGLVFDGDSRVMDIEAIFRGFPSLYVALRPSPNGMVALRYCGMRHFPCAPRAPSPPAPDPWNPERLDTPAALAFFDYFIVRTSPDAAPDPVLPKSSVVEIARSGAWAAYRRDR